MNEAQQHLLILDEGTTSTRAVLFDASGAVVDSESAPLELHARSGGFVEQSAKEILDSSVHVLKTVIARARLADKDILGLGIASQRATTVIWDRTTGEPAAPVVVWQDTRCAQMAAELAARNDEHVERTGVPILPPNLTLHLSWLLRDDELRRRAEAGELAAGGPESWMVWNLTGGVDHGSHLSVMSVAQPSGGVDIKRRQWWTEWFDELGVPMSLMGTLVPEDDDFGTTDPELLGVELPIIAVIGDQPAALLGQGAVDAGDIKCTYGTGSFVDFNTGTEPVSTSHGLLTLCGWHAAHSNVHMVEGASFTAGAGIEWLIDTQLLERAEDLDARYADGDPGAGLVFVPTLAGLSGPHHDSEARGLIVGIHRGTTRADIVRAMVDGIANSVTDLIEAIADDAGRKPSKLFADGGLAKSDALLQLQADLLNIPVQRALDAGATTARGAALLAGVKAGIWNSLQHGVAASTPGTVFEPTMSDAQRDSLRAAWGDAVQRTLGWRPATAPAMA